MNRIRKWAAILAAAALLGHAGLAHAQKPADPATTGVKVGDKAPAFKLKDANGDEHSLADLLKKSDKTALVFYRSSDWWPFCKKQLVQLDKDLEKIEAAGIQVVGISYDSVEKLKQFTEKTGSKLLLLSDEGSKTIDAYGIRNKEMAGRPIDGIPYPGTYIVDKEGVIRAKLFLDGYLLRHTTDALIEGAGK